MLIKKAPQLHTAQVFAPTNIAMIKYWGKRDSQLNLPVTSSLSITLPEHGTNTKISLINDANDVVILNNTPLSADSHFYQKIIKFIDIFRLGNEKFCIETVNNIPTAAGLASSASGFAALTLTLNEIYQHQLSNQQLSIIARTGSGSACRSLWNGFVLWQKGNAKDGSDSFAFPLDMSWPELRIGIHYIETQQKSISSRDAMNLTTKTSPLYCAWPNAVAQHLDEIQQAIIAKDFIRFGEIAEQNALTMHATMQAASPPIYFSTPETLNEMIKIWELRKSGIPIYFTQDAGPNLKLLFTAEYEAIIKQYFPELEIITPFDEGIAT